MTKSNKLPSDSIKSILLPAANVCNDTQQRYNIIIPAPRVIFQLGRALGKSDPPYRAGPFGFDGISMLAEDNLYIRVGKEGHNGGEGSGQSTFDVFGAAVFQSRNMWQQWAGHDMVLATSQNLSAIGRERILIFAGELAEDVVDHSTTGVDLEHNVISEAKFKEFITKLQSMDSTFQNIVLGFDVAKALIGGLISVPTTWDSIVAKIATKLLDVYEWGSKVKGSFSKKEGKSSDLTLYGESAVSVLTDETLALISKGEAKVLANEGVKIAAGLGCSIEAGLEAKTFGGVAACLGSGLLTEVTGYHAVEMAARLGPVEIKGVEIGIGNTEEKVIKALESHPRVKKVMSGVKVKQRETKKVEVGAKEAINVVSEGSVQLLADAEPEKNKAKGELDIKAKEKITIEADEAKGIVQISVGPFVVKISDKKIQLGQAASKGGDPTKSFLSIDEHGAVTLESSNATKLMLSNKRGLLRDGSGSNELKVAGNGVAVKATKLNLC